MLFDLPHGFRFLFHLVVKTMFVCDTRLYSFFIFLVIILAFDHVCLKVSERSKMSHVHWGRVHVYFVRNFFLHAFSLRSAINVCMLVILHVVKVSTMWSYVVALQLHVGFISSTPFFLRQFVLICNVPKPMQFYSYMNKNHAYNI